MGKVIDIEEGKRDLILHTVSKLEPIFKRNIENVKKISGLKEIKNWIKSVDSKLYELSDEIQYNVFLNLLIISHHEGLIQPQDSSVLLNYYMQSAFGKE